MSEPSFKELPVALERDVFLRTLIRELAGTLQDVVGLEEASGYISVVGRTIGMDIDRMYREALGTDTLERKQIPQVLIDLKRRIQGDFYIIEENEERIVFGNNACPFAEKVLGRPSMCMMTSNVFGVVAAENLGYARVDIEEAIAEGSPQCRVVVYLKPSESGDGREYYRSFDA